MIYLAFYPVCDRLQNRKREHQLGRALLSYGLKREYEIPEDQIRILRHEGGKPYLDSFPDIYFNISHCDGAVVCAVHQSEIGVDIETLRPYSKALAERILTDRELDRLSGMDEEEKNSAFIRYWTLKESYYKALGDGLAKPFRGIEFQWDLKGKAESSDPSYSHYERRVRGKFQIAVSIKRREGMNMTYQEVFEEVKGIFEQTDVSGITEHMAFEFDLEGEVQGAFYAEVSGGKLDVQPYEYHDRDVRFISSADTLLKIVKGQMDPVVAFTIGKLKVEGDLTMALKIQQLAHS